jgi:putative transposase
MPRRLLIRSNEFPYHVTARANNKERFPIELARVWEIAVEELYFLGIAYSAEVQGFVLMPNHFHLLITVPHFDLGVIMRELMRTMTKRINGCAQRTGHVFGGPHNRSIITSTRYFGHALKYVYRNPVRAGILNSVEKYEFSTARGLFGEGVLPFPIHFTRIGLEINLPDANNPMSWLDWLNRPFPIETEKLIQKSIRKREIKELINPTNRRPYPELNYLI